MPLKAPHLRPAFDWSGFYIGGHTGYSRGSSNAALADPLPLATDQQRFQRRDRRRAGRLQLSAALRPAARRRSRPDLSELHLPSNSIVSKLATARSDVTQRWTMSEPCAAASATPAGHWLAYATGGFALAGERFSTRPPSASKRSIINVRLGWAAGAGARIRFRAALERAGSNISTPSSASRRSLSVRARSTPQRSIFSRFASASTARSTGRGSPTWTQTTDLTDPESDRWEIHGQTTYLGKAIRPSARPTPAPTA